MTYINWPRVGVLLFVIVFWTILIGLALVLS